MMLKSFSPLADNLVFTSFNSLPDDKFRLFQTERVCRRQFKFEENGRKLSKRVENTVGEGEITHYEQFLLFPQCFQKACFRAVSKGVIVWEWVNSLPDNKILDLSELKAFSKYNVVKMLSFAWKR